jgi:hypothetical protein
MQFALAFPWHPEKHASKRIGYGSGRLLQYILSRTGPYIWYHTQQVRDGSLAGWKNPCRAAALGQETRITSRLILTFGTGQKWSRRIGLRRRARLFDLAFRNWVRTGPTYVEICHVVSIHTGMHRTSNGLVTHTFPPRAVPVERGTT